MSRKLRAYRSLLYKDKQARSGTWTDNIKIFGALRSNHED